MDTQVEVTWITLHTISHSFIIHARVLEAYIHFALMYTADHIFPVLPIKDLINEEGEPTTPFKLATGMNPSVSNFRVLFCPCVVQKSTVHVGKKALNMRHQAQKGFRGIFIVIPQYQKWYLVDVPHKHNIVSSYDVVSDDIFLVLWHTHQNHIQKQWLCELQCNTYHMIHLQRNKLAI